MTQKVNNTLKRVWGWVCDYKMDIGIWLICISYLIWVLHPLLSDRVMAGWDLTSHFYLVKNMEDLLKEGRISGYSMSWFSGYPVFNFYAPLMYILIAGAHIVLLGTVSLALVFNVFVFLLPFLFLLSMYITSRIWFGRESGYMSLILGLIFLSIGKSFGFFGLGISGEIAIGLLANFFAMSLLILLLGVFGKLVDKKSRKMIIVGILLWASIILSHTLTMIFTTAVFTIFSIFYWKKLWKEILIIFFGGVILTSFWTIPFLLNIGFSAGLAIGVQSATSDPLFILYPGIYDLIHGPTVQNLPYAILMISSVVGLIYLLKKQRLFWPMLFLLTLIVLPREYLINITNIPIHYYRFIAYIFVINLFIATAGMKYIFDSIKNIKKVLLSVVLNIIAWVYVLLSICIACFINFDMLSGTYQGKYNYFVDEYEYYPKAVEIMEYLKTLEPKGRIAAESSMFSVTNLGTPHFFLDFLPLNYGMNVMPGLLAESSLSSRFFIPALAVITNSMPWGNVSLLGDPSFTSQSTDSMIERIGLYGVEYLLLDKSSAEKLLENMKDKEMVEVVKMVDIYSLLKVNKFRPYIAETDYKPFLFIQENEWMDFQTLTNEWYKNPDIFEYPVIYTEKSYDDISEHDKTKIGGLIVAMPQNSVLTEKDVKKWENLEKRVIFINAIPEDKNLINENVKFIPVFDYNYGIEELSEYLKAYSENTPVYTEIKPDKLSDHEIQFNSEKGILLNYSYFPYWKSENSNQEVFWATPTMMFLFGQEENTLKYK